MSSFFTAPGAQKKRKRNVSAEVPKKRIAATKKNGPGRSTTAAPKKKRPEREESISGSDSDDDDDDDSDIPSDMQEDVSEDESDESEEETAAERRLRLAERYLENVKQHVDEAGFDAADIDRDMIAERLQEDIAETKGRVYRQLASGLALQRSSQTLFRTNTHAVTSVAACAPYVYTVTKDTFLHRWRIQDLPKDQYPQTTKRKSKKPAAPPRRKPELETWIRGNTGKAGQRQYKRHTGRILAVAASPDGKYVVTGGDDKKMIVYEAATLKPIKVLTHHRDAVTGLAFRRGTNQLYSCSKDRTVKVWSLDEMAYVETLFGHQDEVIDIDALAQERCVSVGARDRTARLWKVMEETQLVFRGGAVDKKAKHPGVDKRSLLAEGTMDRVAMIDDELFVTGSDNGSIALWSVAKKKPVYIEPLAHGVDPPLDPHAASAEKQPSGKEIPAPTPRWITALKTIPYSDVILSGSWDGRVKAWRLSEDKRKIELVGCLGAQDSESAAAEEEDGDDDRNGAFKQLPQRPIEGIINGISVFERGERGQDGLCVVAAVSNEHRLGRWKVRKGARNGGVVFEVPRLPGGEAEVEADDQSAEGESSEE
ncbi:WD40/YVTN repeat-like-containing domain protein [Cordyceps fumosorosea ARSEF 2679]|uniref:WD40/YVTN repeat-like-containing domain protein n=1 Tax=Cordyceps fumosorosea (strain ARSEF 2679) TaxID=1081104 RepID=A0A168EP71_CORFA|nr:WD40/YVTN repeat-like-containing domain protein [Cordyceps fumosorosea ARSEF 2679]OAA74057.1 WD40/YVTN repeat-like-containing domain protein [Cordyceps fumosorosea ARSEF 2679]